MDPEIEFYLREYLHYGDSVIALMKLVEQKLQVDADVCRSECVPADDSGLADR